MANTKKNMSVLKSKTCKVPKGKPKINFKDNNLEIKVCYGNFFKIIVKAIEILGVIGNLIILLKDFKE